MEPVDEPTLASGDEHAQWRMISDSILYDGDADAVELQMELLEEVSFKHIILYLVLLLINYIY
jgi:hypothetical protein